MNFHTKHPLVKALIAVLIVGAFAFAVGHALDHGMHEIHCAICHWVYGGFCLISAAVALGALYAHCFVYWSNPTFFPHQFFLAPKGRSPPAVS